MKSSLQMVAVLLPMLASTLSNSHNVSNQDDGKHELLLLRSAPSKIKKPIPMNYSQSLCTLDDGTNGICYKSSNCTDHGGKILGLCEDGKDACCVVERSCNNITKEKVSYFVNPSYPKLDFVGFACEFRINIINSNVCQIRLDFENMSLAGPHWETGFCRQDRLVPMTSLPNFILLSEMCGENSGQHIYIPVDGTVEDPFLSLMVMTSGIQPYHWRIRNMQIDCKLQPELVAPAGCLQYHDTVAGSIKSLNYGDGHGHYQSNLDYAICIKRLPKTCSIEYSQAEKSAFWINSAKGASLSEGVGQAGMFSCDLHSHDYLNIPDGRGPKKVEDEGDGTDHLRRVVSSATSDKFCGRSLSGLAVYEYAKRLKSGIPLDLPIYLSNASTVTSYASGPFILRFHSDKTVDPTQEVGFHIKYEQLPTGCKTPFV